LQDDTRLLQYQIHGTFNENIQTNLKTFKSSSLTFTL
jgi:hypothetical protein